MQVLQHQLRDVIGPQSLLEINKINGAVVKEACSRMRPGKADVTGSFTSDVLLHGPDLLFEHLEGIFRSFLVHGNVTLGFYHVHSFPYSRED